MDWLGYALAAFGLGALAGALCARWLLRPGVEGRAAAARELTAAQERLAALQERLAARERELEQQRAALDERQRELGGLREQLQSEGQRRAAAEGRCEELARLPGRLAQLETALETERRTVAELQARIAEFDARLQQERAAAVEKLQLLEQARERLADAFKALSAQALESNNQQFLQLAQTALAQYQEGAKKDLDARQQTIEQLVRPLRESLVQVDSKLQQIEKERVGAYSGLTQHLETLRATQERLQAETGNLVRALRAPQVRGRWGEIQLRRVVELAGMVNYCDFQEQASVKTADGMLRPDMIVRLPNGRVVVVDAKAPLSAYLEALECSDDAQRLEKLRQHARQVREHCSKLARKDYWSQFGGSAEFVVLFLPGETFFSAALEQAPDLLEHGVEQNVVLATPTTLISLLKAVAYGWRQEQIAQNAAALQKLGAELYGRLSQVVDHLEAVGRHLGGAVAAYNRVIGSLESRVLVSARRFRELGATPAEELPLLEPLALSVRDAGKLPRAGDET